MKGQTLFEIVIALAIFSMVASILVSVSLGGFTALTQGGDQTKASALAEEGIEALRSIRDGAWNELRPAGGSQTAIVTGAISISGNQWIFTAGALAEILGKYTRTITLEAVCRDPQTRIITVCPVGAPDPHTERATVTVSWETRPGVTNTVTRSSYVTSWDSRTWRQTDWAAGAGQAIWSQPARYNLDDGNIDTASAELKLRQNSSTWIVDPSFSWAAVVGGPIRDINSIDASSGTNVWAVANAGVVLKYNGSSWSRINHGLGTRDMRAVDVIGDGDVWTAGVSGRIYHMVGTSWTETNTGSHTWNAISFASPTLGFAVGNAGWIARYNGSTWTVSKIVSGYSGNLRGIFMVSPTEGWAVGASGKIFFWNGTTWTEDEDTGGQLWQGIMVFSGANDGWIMGTNGAIRRWDGNNWNDTPSPTNRALNAFYLFDQTSGWGVGDVGSIIRWNNSLWQNDTSPTSVNLNALTFAGNVGWAVGNNGTILKLLQSSTFRTNGSLVSSAFPLVGNSPVESLEWDESIPLDCVGTCKIKFQIQVAPDNGGVPGAWFPSQWMGPEGDDGDEDDYFTLATGHLIPNIANGRQWVRYKVELEGDGASTPVLQEVRIQYK